MANIIYEIKTDTILPRHLFFCGADIFFGVEYFFLALLFFTAHIFFLAQLIFFGPHYF